MDDRDVHGLYVSRLVAIQCSVAVLSADLQCSSSRFLGSVHALEVVFELVLSS